jgi:hypothetical protein
MSGKDDISGRTIFVLGLALFVVGILDPMSVVMTDEELAKNNGLHTLLGIGLFWGGVIVMTWGVTAWRRDRRVARGEPAEVVSASEQRREQLIASPTGPGSSRPRSTGRSNNGGSPPLIGLGSTASTPRRGGTHDDALPRAHPPGVGRLCRR